MRVNEANGGHICVTTTHAATVVLTCEMRFQYFLVIGGNGDRCQIGISALNRTTDCSSL